MKALGSENDNAATTWPNVMPALAINWRAITNLTSLTIVLRVRRSTCRCRFKARRCIEIRPATSSAEQLPGGKGWRSDIVVQTSADLAKDGSDLRCDAEHDEAVAKPGRVVDHSLIPTGQTRLSRSADWRTMGLGTVHRHLLHSSDQRRSTSRP